ncbi:hypothetical protein [Clostridium neonatale]|uniref:Uncharacterized protein n=2 Tax=root TaxID=1 RepID=A0AAD1YIN6_9CLOT|nr:hypothetical protein [Clostridium neonatale]DAF76161.1 MAG TPA: Rad52/22 family double-strand break repair protein [Caudoviricetes sp.]DAF94589.1 MAG TPA: Rad52/22 family double-strand break repair protein [Siphoviridae sp. ct3gT1]CAI3202288.1 conserved hypothetical protein [Clostridium neonatale]CAI3223188.1 conserved hypothetical protein [Clostridium neonatale]CAI3246662.1 conserved hypothetical protein [Clostridium neonatale]
MSDLQFRKLRECEIDVRVQSALQNGVILLLYKDARCDMNILDETVGPTNWTRSHQVIDGKLYCTVSLYDEVKQQWVSKQDVGTESNTEKEKGQASDSFKRACFNWGLGRELYTAPFIWVPADKCNIKQDKGKFKCNDKFRVEKISYDSDGCIDGVSIMNDTAKVRCFVKKPKEEK